jgi:hypothetical protein
MHKWCNLSRHGLLLLGCSERAAEAPCLDEEGEQRLRANGTRPVTWESIIPKTGLNHPLVRTYRTRRNGRTAIRA